jgi:hypothetical protein
MDRQSGRLLRRRRVIRWGVRAACSSVWFASADAANLPDGRDAPAQEGDRWSPTAMEFRGAGG